MSRRLTICSQNILSDDYLQLRGKGSTGFMRRYYPTVDKSLMPMSRRLPKIIKKMREIDADVYCLQEVMVSARTGIKKAFPEYHVCPLARHNLTLDGHNHNRTGNLVLVRKSRLTGGKATSIDLGTEGYRIGQTEVVFGDKPIVLLSVHLTDTPGKYKQIKTLLEVCRRHRDASKTVIVAGDFNTASARMHQQMERAGFRSMIPRTTRKMARGTYLCEGSMIDYIYIYSPEEYEAKGTIDNSPLDRPGTHGCYDTTIRSLGADHYPIVGSITYKHGAKSATGAKSAATGAKSATSTSHA